MFQRANIRQGGNDAAFLRAMRRYPQPSSIGELQFLLARHTAIKGELTRDPSRIVGGSDFPRTACGQSAEQCLEVGSNLEQIRDSKELLAAVIEGDQPILAVPEREAVGDALDRIAQPIAR